MDMENSSSLRRLRRLSRHAMRKNHVQVGRALCERIMFSAGHFRQASVAVSSTNRPPRRRRMRWCGRASSRLCVTSTSAVSSSSFISKIRSTTVAGGFGIEIAGRFVGEKNVRAIDEGASQRDALLFATAQLRRIMIQPIAQADTREQLLRVMSSRHVRRAVRAESSRSPAR